MSPALALDIGAGQSALSCCFEGCIETVAIRAMLRRHKLPAFCNAI